MGYGGNHQAMQTCTCTTGLDCPIETGRDFGSQGLRLFGPIYGRPSLVHVNRPGNCGDSFAWKGKSNVYTEEEANPAGEEATAVCFPAEVSA
jgi:hypothetical protein